MGDSSNTEVGAFEPLPDSPTGRGAADQQQLPAASKLQSPPPGQQQQQQYRKVTPQLMHCRVCNISARLTDLFCCPVLLRQAAATTQGPFPGTAHVHLIGEITGAVGLGLGPLYATWQLVYDAQLWSVAGGQDKVCQGGAASLVCHSRLPHYNRLSEPLCAVLCVRLQGRTHASSPQLSEDGGLSGVMWECPLDILLTTSSWQHWPSIVFKLFHRSIWLGR